MEPLVISYRFQDSLTGLEKIDYRLYRKETVCRRLGQRFDGNFTSRIKGDDIVIHFLAGVQNKEVLKGVNLDGLPFDGASPSVLGQFPYMKTHLQGW